MLLDSHVSVCGSYRWIHRRDVFVLMGCVSRCWIHMFQSVFCADGFTCSSPWFVLLDSHLTRARVAGFTRVTFCLVPLFSNVSQWKPRYQIWRQQSNNVLHHHTESNTTLTSASLLLLLSTNLTSFTACRQQRRDFSRNQHYTKFGVTLGIGTVSI